jgi:hypothetical protein
MIGQTTNSPPKHAFESASAFQKTPEHPKFCGPARGELGAG